MATFLKLEVRKCTPFLKKLTSAKKYYKGKKEK